MSIGRCKRRGFTAEQIRAMDVDPDYEPQQCARLTPARGLLSCRRLDLTP